MYHLVKSIPIYAPVAFSLYMIMFFSCQVNTRCGDALELDTRKGSEAYRWYTYSLIHFDGIHLAVNMLNLIFFAALTEFYNGFWRTFAIHTCSIFGGAFAAGWESRILDESFSVIGVSGGNYGLLSSQIGFLSLNWHELSVRKRVVHIVFITCPVVADIVSSVVSHSDSVSYSAHVGGFVFGLFAGLTLMRNIRVLKSEKVMQKICGGVFLASALAGSVNLGLL
jgi:membrane associated rhomboid family serine protease